MRKALQYLCSIPMEIQVVESVCMLLPYRAVLSEQSISIDRSCISEKVLPQLIFEICQIVDGGRESTGALARWMVSYLKLSLFWTAEFQIYAVRFLCK
jgi:hypothetical protein